MKSQETSKAGVLVDLSLPQATQGFSMGLETLIKAPEKVKRKVTFQHSVTSFWINFWRGTAGTRCPDTYMTYLPTMVVPLDDLDASVRLGVVGADFPSRSFCFL